MDLFLDKIEPVEANEHDWFADVLLPYSLPKPFTYRIPRELVAQVQKGLRVVVPFGKRKFHTGLIWQIHQTAPQYFAKYIEQILDDEPLFLPFHYEFWNWLSAYYLANLGDVFQAALPSGLKVSSETVIHLNGDADLNRSDLTENEWITIESLNKNGSLSLAQLAEIIGQKHAYSTVKNLYFKDIVLTEEELKRKYRPKVEAFIRIHEQYRQEERLNIILNQLEKRAPKQFEALMRLLQENQDWIQKSVCIQKYQITRTALNQLIEKEIVEESFKQVDRMSLKAAWSEIQPLSPSQKMIATQLDRFWKDKTVALLYGITGSGKTHLYFEYIKNVLNENGQALYLLPEIALTNQLLQRLQAYFGVRVMISHSKYSQAHRVELFEKIRNGESVVVVGARSAIFLPFVNLQLIIVDEEHDASFKQQEPAPRYQARDAAIWMGSKLGIKVLLGSATPSAESWHNAQSGKYGLVELTDRFGEAVLPEMMAINMAEQNKRGLLKGIFSTQLLDALQIQLKAKRQSILFQNRKGFTPLVQCKSCGWIARCISCDISLTYHKTQHHLRCHYCGYKEIHPKACPACSSQHLEFTGFGTERVAEELQLLIPEAHIARFDQETAKTRQAQVNLIQSFENAEIDILVGTQMIAKGLDFENLTLVGILSADSLLNFPHYRSYERAFQLITQVAGRAGRRKEIGLALIQSYQPHHPVLRLILSSDYKTFISKELKERSQYDYPPFCRIIEVWIKHKEENKVEQMANMFAKELQTAPWNGSYLGPEKPHAAWLKSYHQRRILIKLGLKNNQIQVFKAHLLRIQGLIMERNEFKRGFIYFDVDPN